MKYPSLVILDKAAGKMSRDVTVDLKLDLFLSENTLDIMTNLVCEKCIAERQKIFASLNCDAAFEHMVKLHELSKKLCNTIKAYEEIEKENSKKAVFVSVCRLYTQFCDEASKPMASKLGERFSEYFSEIRNGEFVLFGDKTNSLYNRIKKILRVGAVVNSDGASFGFDTQESFTDILKRAYMAFCPEKISAASAGDYCFSFTEELLKSDEGLCEEINDFYKEYGAFVDLSIAEYKGETGFYLDIHSLIGRIKKESIPAVMPVFTDVAGITADDVYDFTLIAKNEKRIIPNNIRLSEDMKFCFLQGANGGGKTTYLRCIGANLLLALSGSYVFANRFEVCAFDGVFTHFPRDERFERGGRLCDEEARLDLIVNTETKKNIVLLNETFSTTTQEISIKKTADLAHRLKASGFAGVYVTHCDISENCDIPVMCVLVDPNNENERTYKVAFKGEKSSSFALDILKKYSLDYSSLCERFGEI